VVAVNLEKALDCATRSKMWSAITRYGIPVSIFKPLMLLHFKLCVKEKPSALLPAIAGVRQGFFLSPRIFLMIVG
jgi:hypothetical protein